MKYKKTIIRILKTVGFAALIFLAIFITNQYQASNLEYGKKSNEIRKAAKIPTIKTSMYSKNVNNNLLGNQWVNIRKEPNKGEVLHLWKRAIPKNDNKTLFKETDAFRKMDENEIIYHLNLYSIMENGHISEQDAILSEVSSPYESRKKINGIELKNLLTKWKILELK